MSWQISSSTTTRLALLTLIVAGGVAAIVGSGGGGGGDEGGPAGSAPTTASYAIDAPQASLGQTEMVLNLGSGNVLTFKKGPDGSINLPKASGTFDILSAAMTADTGSKLWLDLPPLQAAAGSAKVSVSATEKMEWTLGDEPSAGALSITPRSDDASGLTGTVRLRFKVDCDGTVQPFRVDWDSNNDGTFEQHACYSGDAFPDVWSGTGDLYAQVASAAYLGWSALYSEFEFTVEAMRRVETNYDSIAAAPAGTSAASVSCNLYPLLGSAGSYSLKWADNNGSGGFNTGDTVQMAASGCWINNPGDPEDLRITGTLELRSYARNQGAAPTFSGMTLTQTLENPAGTFADQGAAVLNGGFTLNAPGIAPSASAGAIGAFNFTNGNMFNAARVAASSAAFFPPESQLTLEVIKRVRAGGTGTQSFNLNDVCGNSQNGTAALLWTDLGSPGFSADDSASLDLGNCDLDGTLTTGHIQYTFTAVTLNSTWTTASADVNIPSLATVSTTKSGGFSGKMSVEVDSAMRTVVHRPGAANGVITATASGQNAWQLGCFEVRYQDSGPGTPYAVVNPGVLKASNKIMSITGGGSLFLQFKLGTPDFVDSGGFTLVSFSLPECAALGVPNGVGDSDGNYVTVQDSSLNDNFSDFLMTLYNSSNVVLGTAPTSWKALVQ
jgi:hypothetical protein